MREEQAWRCWNSGGEAETHARRGKVEALAGGGSLPALPRGEVQMRALRIWERIGER